MEPYELVLSPAEVYVAFEGEAFPNIDAVPAGNWVLLGTAGSRNQGEAGVKITHNQTVATHSTAGATGPVKAIRTAEETLVDVVMEDMTPEVYAKALNLAGITETAAASAVAGKKVMGLSRGRDVQTFAILVRVPASAYGDGLNSQWEFPKGFQNASPTLQFDGAGTAVGLAFQYKILEDQNAVSDFERFGRFITQTAAALP